MTARIKQYEQWKNRRAEVGHVDGLLDRLAVVFDRVSTRDNISMHLHTGIHVTTELLSHTSTHGDAWNYLRDNIIDFNSLSASKRTIKLINFTMYLKCD